MRLLRRILAVVGWLSAAAVVLVLGAYVTALAVNRYDRLESAQARELTAEWQAIPPVVDSDNAYVYLLGFGAPRGADPWRVGSERAAWIRRLRTSSELDRGSDPYPEAFTSVWAPARDGFFDRCPNRSLQRECFAILSEAGAEIGRWLGRHEWVLERYAKLLSNPGWREVTTYDYRNPDPIFGLTQAQRAWFLEAWRRAGLGDVDGVRELLSDDLEFWRLVLAESQSLLWKALAASFVEHHFKMANIVLKRLPADRVAPAVPASWRETVSQRERSIRRALAAELESTRKHAESLLTPAAANAAYRGTDIEPPTLMERFNDWSSRAFVQPQDFVNKQARLFAHLAEAAGEAYDRLPEAFDRARATDVFDTESRRWSEPLYNFMLDSLVGDGIVVEAYVDIAARIADVEGIRRAGVSAAELRSRGIEPDDVEAALADSTLTGPYRDEPFTWDAESGEIVFDGIARGYRGRHAFWY